MPASTIGHCGGLPERYRRLFRECRWRGIRGCVSPSQSVRPHSRVWAGFHVQRDLAVTWSDPAAALDASDLDQTVNVSRFSSFPTFLHVMGTSCAMSQPGSARDESSIAKTWLRDSRTLQRLSSPSCAERISANPWCVLRDKSPAISP